MKLRRLRKLVVVIDDDPLVLEATQSLLHSWGCRVVAANSCGDAMTELTELGERPDLIVCDYLLSPGPTGLHAIERLREAFEIPALLVSGDGSLPESRRGTAGYRLLHKPVDAETLREMLIDASVLQSRE